MAFPPELLPLSGKILLRYELESATFRETGPSILALLEQLKRKIGKGRERKSRRS